MVLHPQRRARLPPRRGMNRSFATFLRDDMYVRYLDGLRTTPTSVTLDLGSYKGQSLVRLRSKVQGVIHGFEPIVSFWNQCRNTIQPHSDIYVHPIGVGDVDEVRDLFVSDDETSAIREASQRESCTFRSFASVWAHLRLQTLDVLHMNIEGGEYAVIRSILSHGLLPKIKTIVVQFHYPEQYSAERAAIQAEFRKTHTCVYNYAFVWERWDLIEE
jgi:FkbM family methyltransferase